MTQWSAFFVSTLVAVSALAANSSTQVKAKKNPASVAASAPEAVQTTVAPTPSSSPGVARNNSVSERIFSPAQGQQAFSLQMNRIYSDLNTTTTVRDSRMKDFETIYGNMLMVQYKRGLANNWTFTSEIGTPVGVVEVSRYHQRDGQLKGLTDLHLGAHRVVTQNDVQNFYGGRLGLSHQERVLGGQLEDGNLTTGGTSFSVFGGRQKDYRKFVVGARAHYDIKMDRSESAKAANNLRASITRTNGNILGAEVYMERAWGQMTYGGSFGLDMVQASDTSISIGGRKVDLTTGSYNMYNVGAYGRIPTKILGGMEFLPSVSTSKMLFDSGGTLNIRDSTEMTNVSVAARKAF